jgi:hypothetical protein
VTQTADDMRRLAGTFVLFFAGCWLLVVFGAVLGLTRGGSVPPPNWIFILLPVTAFVPHGNLTFHEADAMGMLFGRHSALMDHRKYVDGPARTMQV